MNIQEQPVQIYRVTHFRLDGSKAKTRFIKAKKLLTCNANDGDVINLSEYEYCVKF